MTGAADGIEARAGARASRPDTDRTPPAGRSRGWVADLPLLVAGCLLFAVANGRWVVPAATWLAPALLLAWTRRRSPAAGFVVLGVVLAGINMVAWSGTAKPEWLPAALGPAIALVFLADRLLAGRVVVATGSALLATLPFPLAYTTLDFAVSRLSPLGSIGAIGSTQVEQLALVQLAALTGAWGLTFIVAWFAPVACAVVDADDRATRRRVSAAFAIVLLAVLVAGGARVAFAPPAPASVRVAGVTLVDRGLGAELWAAQDGDAPRFAQLNAAIRRDAEVATRREALAGARIVLFSEASIQGYADDAETLLAWGAGLARESGTMLVVPLYLAARAPGTLDQNALVVFDTDGRVVLRHRKFGAAATEDIEPGSGTLAFIDTPSGRIGAVICRDMDFPAVIQQAGSAGADLVLAPSFDWREIDPFHTRYAVLRGVENGFSLVRQTADGLSIATDPYGRVVASMDHFATDDRVMVAQVPMAGQPTLYGRLGDWFGWLSVVGLGLLGVLAVTRGGADRGRR